jgi:hypothetical protein
MKKLALLFTLAVLFISCEGPQGPPGFDGLNGVNFVGQSYEFTDSFLAPDYTIFTTYPADIEVFSTDMTLVYILWEVDSGVDVWRLLPQTVYSDAGEFQYNYDATTGDASIFLDGPLSTDFSLLAPADLENQTFRVVILPVDLANDPGVDITNMQSVLNAGGITTNDIIKTEP